MRSHLEFIVLLLEILVFLAPELDELRCVRRVQRDGWHVRVRSRAGRENGHDADMPFINLRQPGSQQAH